MAGMGPIGEDALTPVSWKDGGDRPDIGIKAGSGTGLRSRDRSSVHVRC